MELPEESKGILTVPPSKLRVFGKKRFLKPVPIICGLYELFFWPKTRDLLDGTVKNTGKLKMLPLVFPARADALEKRKNCSIKL